MVSLGGCDVNRRAAAPAPVRAAPPTVPRATEHFQASIASFERDQLAFCADFVLDVVHGDSGFDREKADRRFEAFVAGVNKNAKGLRVPRACSEQFSDRTAFASCAVAPAIPSGGAFAMVESYYLFERVFGSDATMKDCLEMQGEWHAVSRTSAAFRDAQLRRDMSSARRMVEKASKALEADTEN